MRMARIAEITTRIGHKNLLARIQMYDLCNNDCAVSTEMNSDCFYEAHIGERNDVHEGDCANDHRYAGVDQPGIDRTMPVKPSSGGRVQGEE